MEDCRDTHELLVRSGALPSQRQALLGRALPLPKLSPALGRTGRDLRRLQREPSRFH
jgi:hypothetical protein